MAKTFLIPFGGSGGGDMSNYYTKQQIDAMFQGVQSIQGLQGADGAEGSQGIQGTAGQNGTNGLQGIQGADGASIQGLQGEQGIQGTAGQNGTNGVQGTQGIAGQNGANGQQGIQGIAGQDGTNGVDGLQGIQGAMGIQGPAGGGGATRYDIATKSQAELAEFYQNWETVMASNDVYVGIYPVTAVIPEYTVQGYTALLLEYNTSFALEEDATTQTPVVKGDVGAYYILPNGMGGTYGTDVTMPSKNYVDAVVAGIQAIQGIQGTAGTNGVQGVQGTAGTNGVDGLQGIQGIQGASGGGASKIELMTLPVEQLVQFYQATLAGTMKDFSQYTANGYPLINAYQMNAGWVVDTSYYTGTAGTTYTTDGTEVALVLNQRFNATGTQSSETTKSVFANVTLFSPTIVQTYGASLDTYVNIKGGSDTVSLQFTLADDSVVNYTMVIM